MSEIITSLQTELSNRHANMVSEAVLAFSEHHDSALHSYFLNARVKDVILESLRTTEEKLRALDKLQLDASKNLSNLLVEYNSINAELESVNSKISSISSQEYALEEFQALSQNFEKNLVQHRRNSQNKLKCAMEKLKMIETSTHKAILDNF
ncbi:hypothetical protein POMI540_0561 [Schizosaccharomyces pombe]|uniref:Linear element protein Mug20 n=1 Tax=Schizosaccharomyces pombe (strain 972 / ATCC 24843) TaxID=284812 RepID=MUG20_SCHPO|nr:protein mug20 [Schizosaccharomyces pombe]Q9HGN4.2 RecName: Full=Linear element protein Mug20; AltName: Full=Meiotically up-regulated gene 20 protein [Schizosaccharomyces pombe 972h-]CAC05727.2 sequence orphan [Schizosaccharomyces pombe]|eukprot:NP_595988.2 protein mug20 [Schizosaccharomyces pombe]